MKKFLKYWILILIILLLGIYSIFVEPNMINVIHYSIKDEQLSGIKVVFVTDFHIKPFEKKRLERIVDMVNSQNPDIVLSVGDFVCGHLKSTTMPIEDIAKTLGKIYSKSGFYTVLGNHDAWYGNKRITKALQKNKITVLNNSNIKTVIKNKSLYIAGVEDMMWGNPDLDRAFAGTKNPIIFLTHTPDMFPELEQNVNLTLAGHTHGGQIRIPLIGPIFTASKYGDKYAKGLIEKDGRKLIVSTGLGTSILPLRFNCRPEIVVIDFE